MVEKCVIGALKEAGFDEVVQYDRFLLESIRKDMVNRKMGSMKMLSWCKAAFNYVQSRIPDSKVARSEQSAPWNLLLDEEKGESVCILSPCTALKGVEGFAHVLSVMELDELLKQMEIEPEFAKPNSYQQKVKVRGDHPGFNPIKLGEESSVYSLRISKVGLSRIGEAKRDFLDLYPCFDRCLTGGGNYPTVDKGVIEDRRRWLEFLWEAEA